MAGPFDPDALADEMLAQFDATLEQQSVYNEGLKESSGAVSREFRSGLYGTVGSIAKGAGALVGSQGIENFGDRQSAYAQGLSAGSGMTQSLGEIEDVGDALSYAGRTVLQTAGGLVPTLAGGGVGGLAARGLGLAARGGLTAGAIATSGLSETGQNIEAQEDQAGERNLLSAAVLGAAGGALDAVGGVTGAALDVARGSVNRAVRGGIARRVLGTAASEAAIETGQQALQETARYAVDQEYNVLGSDARERYLEAAVGGAIGGGAVGGALNSLPRGRRPEDKPPVPSPDPTEAGSSTSTPIAGDARADAAPPSKTASPSFAQFSDAEIRKTIAEGVSQTKEVRAVVDIVRNAVRTGDVDKALDQINELGAELQALPEDDKRKKMLTDPVFRAATMLQDLAAIPTEGLLAASPKTAAPSTPATTPQPSATTFFERTADGQTVLVNDGQDVVNYLAPAKKDNVAKVLAEEVRIALSEGDTTDIAERLAIAEQNAKKQTTKDVIARAREVIGLYEEVATAPEGQQAAPVDVPPSQPTGAAAQIADGMVAQNQATQAQQAQLQAEEQALNNQVQLITERRKTLLSDVLNRADPKDSPLELFMSGLKKIDPDAQPSPKELAAIAERVRDREVVAQETAAQTQALNTQQREQLLESIVNGPTVEVQPLQKFLSGLKKIDPEAQPTPEEQATLDAYAKLSYAQKTALAKSNAPKEEAAPAKAPAKPSVTVTPTASDFFDAPSESPRGRINKRVQEQFARRSEAVARIAQSRELQRQLDERKARESAAKNPGVPETAKQASFFENMIDARLREASKAQLRDQQNRIAEQDRKFAEQQKQIEALTKQVETLTESAKKEKQGELFTAKGKPTAAAARAAEPTPPEKPKAPTRRSVPESTPRGWTQRPVEALEQKIAQIIQGWRNPPRVVVFDPMTPRDAGERRAAAEFDRWPFLGLYVPENSELTGTVYIPTVGPALSPMQLKGIIYHESLGHYGLDQAFGTAKDAILRQIWNTRGDVRRAGQETFKDFYDQFIDQGRNPTEAIEVAQARAAEEVLVQRWNDGKLALEANWWNRLRDAITNFARRMGMKPQRWTDAEIIGVLQAGRRAVTDTDPSFTRGNMEEAGYVFPAAAARRSAPSPADRAFASSSEALNKYLLGQGITNPAIRSFAITARDWMQKSRLMTMMGSTFAKYADQLGLTDFARLDRLQQARNALINQKRVEINNLMIEADKLPTKDREALQKFMKAYTQGAKHGFVPDFYNDADRAEVKVDPKAQTMVEKFIADTRDSNAFEVMKKLMQFAYDERQAHIEAINNHINGEADQALTEKGLTPSEIAQIQEVRARQLQMFNKALPKMDGPYFPLGRFGNHMVVAESAEMRALQAKDQRSKEDNARLEAMESDPNHYQVHFFEYRGQAELMREQLQKEQPQFADPKARLTVAAKTELFEQMGESPLLQMQKLRQMVMKDLPDTSFDKETKRKIDTLLSDLYVRSLAENSARKFDARRRNVAGASDDMLRAFHDKMKADVASRAHVSSFAQEMAVEKTLYDQVNQNPKAPEYEDRRDFLQEYQQRAAQQLQLNMNMDSWASELQNKVMLGSSIYYLFTSPRYYIMNLLQPGVYTAPKIAARQGIAPTFRAMTDAYRAFSDVIATRNFAWDGEIDIEKLKLSADEKAFLTAAQQRGKLEFGRQLDFGEWNSAKTPVGRGALAAVHKVRVLSSQVEYLNRVVAGVAAYRLEKQRTKDAAKATEYAIDIIDSTQLDYSTQAQPRLFNMLPKVVTQFRKYQIGMLALQYGMLKNAIASISSEKMTADEKAEARKALLYSWTTLGTVAGAVGIPGAQLAGVLGAMMFGDDDEPLNGERWTRGQFSDDAMGRALRLGIPSLVGLEMGSVGLGSVLNPLPFFDYTKLDEPGGALQMFGAALGPAASALAGIAERGAREGVAGAAEQALPNGIRNAIKGYQMATAGLERRNGDVIMTADEIGTVKAMLQAAGFRNVDIAETLTRYYETTAAEKYYRERVTDLKRDYIEAKKSNNREAMQSAIESWRSMNEAKKRFDLKPTPLSELLAAERQQQERVKKFRERAGIS